MYIENRYSYYKESEGTILINFTPHQLVTIKTCIVCTEANTHALIIIVTIAGKIQTKVELVANLMRCGKLNAAQLLICCPDNHRADCTNGHQINPELLIIKLHHIIDEVDSLCRESVEVHC